MVVWNLLAVVLLVFFGTPTSAQNPSKRCMGLGEDEYIHGNNINNFTGCTIIQGDIRIMENSFLPDRYMNFPAVEIDDLQLLSTIEEITGHLLIQGEHDDFVSLDFLRNLRTIRGQNLTYVGAAFQIYGTSIKSLDTSSIREISNGLVVISHNPDLCFVNEINWSRLFRTPGQSYRIRFNRHQDRCNSELQVCNNECSDDDGCWGLGQDNCVTCAHVKYGRQCVRSCYNSWNLYLKPGTNECGRCHPECNECFGPGANQCEQCKNVKSGDTCVTACARDQFVDNRRTCQECHSQCKLSCTGPGPDDCDECRKYMDGQACVEECPVGKYVDEFKMCQFCNSECLGGCSGPNVNQCVACKNVNDGGNCISSCPIAKFANRDNMCLPCHSECRGGCTGPRANQCVSCKNVNDGGNCISSCPNGKFANQDNICQACHSECRDGCTGPNVNQCVACKNVNDGGNCISSCPIAKFANRDNMCLPCHSECRGGCTGPRENQCVSCKNVNDGGNCITSCPNGKFANQDNVCQACHSECRDGCTGPDTDNCFACRNVKFGDSCAPQCPEFTYADDNAECQPCNSECRHGCYGEGPSECIACRNYRINGKCVPRCPPGSCPDTENNCGPCALDIVLPTYEQLVEEVMEMKKKAEAARIFNRLELVTFTAYSSPARIDYYSGDHLLFDRIITNIGNAYNPEKSTFVCPRDGVYLFSVSVDNYMRASLVPSIYKGRELIASAGAYNSASQTVVIECDYGENVVVRTSQSGTMFNQYGWRTSTFTGLLLANKP